MKQDEHFVDALARLEELHGKSKRVTARPSTLPIDAIKTVPVVFQPRLFYGGRTIEQGHVKELSRALTGRKKEPLEPVLVIRIGRHAYCIDGHHRLEAYKASRWASEVPVEWFNGTVKEAAQEAIERNSRDKLPMGKSEKLEAAWRLVALDDGLPKSEIARLTTVANGTIGNMRKVLGDLKKQHAASPMEIDEFSGEESKPPFQCRVTWAQAKAFSRGQVEYDPARDDEIIDEWAEKLGKAFGRKWGQRPQLAARAIEKYSPRLPAKLVEAWEEDALEDHEVE